MQVNVLSGIDQINLGSFKLEKANYGLITAAHARTVDGVASRKILNDMGLITHLFSPEHGLEGVAYAGKSISAEEDKMTKLPVYSLYQHGKINDFIPPKIANEIDGLIYDLPDVGARFYTYIATCLQAVDFCATEDKPLIILDRPNPLGGEVVEGLILLEDELSFVGPYTLPNRYALTIAELAKLYIEEKNLDIDLIIVPCVGWERDMIFPETDQVFQLPSPNIPDWQAVLLYPGTCMIEGTNLSEGRGTSRPFSWFGAPYIDQEELFEALNKLEHPGLAIRPQGFIPSYSKNKDLHCKGVTLEIVNPKEIRIVKFMVEAINVIRELYPNDFKFLKSGESTVAFIHKLMGAHFVDDGFLASDFNNRESADVQAFIERSKKIRIY